MQHRPAANSLRPARVLWFSLLAVMLCGLLGHEAAAQAVSFASHVDYGAGHEPHSVAVGDFNRDGNLDLAVANAMSDTVSILLGTGTGSFGPKTDFVGGGGASVAVGDFNGDGKLDLVTAKGGSDLVSILLGNGDGTFGTNTDFGTGSAPVSVAVGDFNGDGHLDVAAANEFGFSVSILLGTGTGTFGTRTDFGTGNYPLSVAVADFNRDGNLDLVTANYGVSGTVSILLGSGTGGFGAKTDIGVGSYPESVAVGDFNGDGNFDLAAAHEVGNAVSIAILLGNGNGTFGPNNDFGTGGTFGSSVAVGDFNGDGKPDLAHAGGSNTVSVLLGNGNGTFGPHSDFQVGFVPESVAIADFNADGKPDLAVANTNPTLNTISILLNTTPFVPTGVFCHKTDFITGRVSYSVAIGDFSRDGKLDLAVANANSNTVTVLVGSGVGSFGRAQYETGNAPVSIAVGDLNGDGKLDLVTANANSDTVSILRGLTLGTFANKVDFSVGATPSSVAIGDFNGDGHADIVTANAASSTVSILLGLGNLAFGARADFGTGATPRSVAVGDFNRDGKLDLAVANYGSNTVSILLGTGVGTFGAKTDFNTGVNPNSVALGDFNGDGKLDLAVANVGSNTVSILLGTGTGLFGAKTDFATGIAPFSVAAGDFNRDGHLDLAVANLNNDNLSVLSGTGLGAFGPKTDFGAGISPRSVAVGDINGDGRLDLAVANEISGNVSVLLNTCSNNPPGINAHPLTVTAGTPPRNTLIADVSDAEDAENTLTMTINGTTSVTINGVRISGMSVNTGGLVTADVEADCSARPGTFELRVTDSGGVSCEALLTVDVIANPTPPSITCPTNIVKSTDPNLCTAVVTYAPTVSGGCSVVGSPICSPASGSVFAKGVTTVNCHVSDSSGNQASCSFTVRVIDTQLARCNGYNIRRNAEPDQCSAVVTFVPDIVDNCPGPFAIGCTPSSGFRFPLGTTLVNCHVIDAAGNETDTCGLSVTIVDAQAPRMAPPANITVAAAASCPFTTSKVVTYATPPASDNCGIQSVICTPPSGSTFPVGTSAVNCTATDTSGNIASTSFTVSVYNFCIQDEMNAGNVVLVNASTGDYSFCCNGVPVASGRGILGVSGCTGSIDQTKGDRRVHIEWDASVNGNAGIGNAYVKSSSSLFCQITDKQLTNNACQCSTQSPPGIIVAPSPPK